MHAEIPEIEFVNGNKLQHLPTSSKKSIKCDVIKQNESEVEKCGFQFFSISYLSII